MAMLIFGSHCPVPELTGRLQAFSLGLLPMRDVRWVIFHRIMLRKKATSSIKRICGRLLRSATDALAYVETVMEYY